MSRHLEDCGDVPALVSGPPSVEVAPVPRNRGWFRPGHTVNVQHGLYSERDLSNLQAEVETFLRQSVTDDGGPSEIGARRQSLHAYRARIHRRIIQLDNALEVRGMVDRRGKLRVAWLQQLASLVAIAVRIDGELGLDRRAKTATSPADAMLREARRV